MTMTSDVPVSAVTTTPVHEQHVLGWLHPVSADEHLCAAEALMEDYMRLDPNPSPKTKLILATLHLQMAVAKAAVRGTP